MCAQYSLLRKLLRAAVFMHRFSVSVRGSRERQIGGLITNDTEQRFPGEIDTSL